MVLVWKWKMLDFIDLIIANMHINMPFRCLRMYFLQPSVHFISSAISIHAVSSLPCTLSRLAYCLQQSNVVAQPLARSLASCDLSFLLHQSPLSVAVS